MCTVTCHFIVGVTCAIVCASPFIYSSPPLVDGTALLLGAEQTSALLLECIIIIIMKKQKQTKQTELFFDDFALLEEALAG